MAWKNIEKHLWHIEEQKGQREQDRGDMYASAQKVSIQHMDRDWKKKVTSELWVWSQWSLQRIGKMVLEDTKEKSN